MGDSKLHGDALNKEKRNSQNAWIPTTHWVGGFLWHYIQRANRENFLYDLRCIDGESMQYTRYSEGQFYGWHNDAGLATQYKPVSVGNRQDGLGQDFINENVEMVRKLSFAMQLSDPDDYEGGNVQLLDEAGQSYIVPRKRGTIVLFEGCTQHRVLKVTKPKQESPLLDGLLDHVGSKVNMAEQMNEIQLMMQERQNTGTAWTLIKI